MIGLQTVPCHIAGKKAVSNSLRDQQNMWAKDFIHTAFGDKCAPNYNQNGLAKYTK